MSGDEDDTEGAAGAGAAVVEVVEYTDPMCPWSWAAEPRLRTLLREAEGFCRHRRVFGVLFDEDEEPAPDPAAETAWYAGYVERITDHAGAPRAARLGWVAASSWPSSLAAAAAEAQGPLVAERVLRRLRESVFVLGEPADTPERVLAAVAGVPGLDESRLRAGLASTTVRERVCRDRAEARRPLPDVIGLRGDGPHPGAAKETEDGGHRYALPTVVFTGPGGRRVVPGWRSAHEYRAALAAVSPAPLPCGGRRSHRHGPVGAVPEPDRARAGRCGRWAVEAGARRVRTANGDVVLHPQEHSGPAVVAARRSPADG